MSNKDLLSSIKKLRELTGVGFKDCKIAIEESKGDIEKSIEFLRKKGIAKASKKSRQSWEIFITEYLLHRESLMTTFVLIDARLAPQKIDLEFMNWCGSKGIPFSIVFTKTDKLSSSALQKKLLAYRKELLKFWDELPPIFVTSSASKFGRESVLNYIEDILKAFKSA